MVNLKTLKVIWSQDHFIVLKIENSKFLIIWVFLYCYLSLLEIKIEVFKFFSFKTITNPLNVNLNNIFMKDFFSKTKILMRRVVIFY